MGKIFDALEKTGRDQSKSLPVSRKRKTDAGGGGDKVVPLASTAKHAEARKLDPNLITYHAPRSVETELFKVLRTNLLFPAEGVQPKTLLVTSALPGDGKTLVSANLGISIAQGLEDHVLLMDCDIRKPNLHRLFGYQNVAGLSEHLAKGRDIAKLLLKTPVAKLSILPGGRPPANPTELLTSKKMQGLLQEVATRYEDRFIVIDSPPPSMAAETTAIAKLVDGVIIVVRSGRTPRSAVTELVEQIGKEKILGVVLNASDQSVKKYYGYGKAYYAKEK